eukprot:366097-Chlamydomonas_euryale.AAC.31
MPHEQGRWACGILAIPLLFVTGRFTPHWSTWGSLLARFGQRLQRPFMGRCPYGCWNGLARLMAGVPMVVGTVWHVSWPVLIEAHHLHLSPAVRYIKATDDAIACAHRACIPVVCAVGSVFIEQKPPSRDEFVALTVLVTGVGIAVWEGSVSGISIWGTFLCICGCTCRRAGLALFSHRFCRLLGTISNGLMMSSIGWLLSEKLDVIRLTFYTAPLTCIILVPFFSSMEAADFKHYQTEQRSAGYAGELAYVGVMRNVVVLVAGLIKAGHAWDLQPVWASCLIGDEASPRYGHGKWWLDVQLQSLVRPRAPCNELKGATASRQGDAATFV